MLSRKMTVSLTSLITIFALAFAVSPVMANKISLRVTDANHAGPGSGDDAPADVSEEPGIQVLAGTHVTITMTSAEPLNDSTIDKGLISPLANTNRDFEINGATVPAGDATATTAGTVGIIRENASKYIITFATTLSPNTAGSEVTLWVVPGSFQSVTTGHEDSTGAMIKFKYVNPDNDGVATAGTGPDSRTTNLTGGKATAVNLDEPNNPTVVSITRATAIGSTIRSAFLADKVSGEFLVKIVLTEKPNGGLHSGDPGDRIKALSVSGGEATGVVIGKTIEFKRDASTGSYPTLSAANAVLPYEEGMYDMPGGTASTPPDPIYAPTGRDDKYYTYLATIVPDGSKDKVVIQVKDFDDLVKPQGVGGERIVAGMYRKPDVKAAKNTREKLEVDVVKDLVAKTAGLQVAIPNGIIIPASGYLVVAKDDGTGEDTHQARTDSTAVVYPGDPADDAILDSDRQPAQRMYNVIKAGLPNLETFLTNGGTIVLMGPSGLVISEIMWGSDASLADSFESQWIEIMNPGAQVKTKDVKLVFYGPGAADQAAIAALDATKVADTVGTVGASGYWSIAGKGQSGRTGVGEAPGDIVAVTPTQALISMQRVIGATGMAADGTMAGSWAASVPPGLNFNTNVEGTRTGTPGASPIAYPVAPTLEPEPTPAPVIPVAMPDDIKITEIMVDTGNGRLPQWIELTNMSGMEKSLAGWSVEIENASADAAVVSTNVSINLSGTLGVGGGTDMGGTMGKSLLLVAWGGRSSSNLSVLGDRLMNVSEQLKQRGRYTLLSPIGFMIELLPPQTTGIVEFGDTAGNLGAAEAWDIPMDETGRSSLIRREMDAGMMTMGTDANGWVLASSTALVDGPATWYGSDEDAGTPGYDAGGPLPVELSHFRPARDKATGTVVITWATQSELNNAGFFIKRSNQRNGQFEVVNPTMIPGAGTTSEKQTYTYTDTTAQPNIVYYYQIEDISLDGNRQTLTRGIRLKGHIGAAGKLTSTWGEIKASNE